MGETAMRFSDAIFEFEFAQLERPEKRHAEDPLIGELRFLDYFLRFFFRIFADPE
jgi:hypothetical protein